MKQEKKQTLWVDLETNLQPWQEQTLSRLHGVKKGELIVYGVSRRSGKSVFYMNGTTMFGSPWGEWTETFVWPWDRKLSAESEKLIWGRIMVRQHMVRYSMDGKLDRQYATKKEVFQRKLKGLD